MQAIIDFLDFLVPYGMYSYWVMFGFLIACGFGFPMPEDIILISGGILSAREICNVWIFFLLSMAGVLIGDGTIFFAGHFFGDRVKSTWLFKRVMKPKTDARIAKFWTKYGEKVVFMARFMPGLRMPIFLTAGIYKVSPLKFFALDGFAAIISVPVWIWVGYIFGHNLEVLEDKIKQFQFGIYGVLVLLVLGFVAIYLLKKRILNHTKNI